jgi:hypothetical protein
LQVTIKVSDVNDNSPKFQSPIYETHVSEAARSGSNVIQVSADDKDLELKGKVIYNITAGDPNGKQTLKYLHVTLIHINRVHMFASRAWIRIKCCLKNTLQSLLGYNLLKNRINF